MNNGDAATSAISLPRTDAPALAQLQLAADLLNVGKRIAVLVGQGAMAARGEVEKLAETLAAPVAKALLGRAVNPDDSAYTTGGIGHLGTSPSEWIMKSGDTLLILGSTMPWYEFYPKPGQARCVQVDINPDRIGLRYPVDVGLIGDVKATLDSLLPLLKGQVELGFLVETQQKVREWNALLDKVEAVVRTPLRPQIAIRAISDALVDDAIITFDCGENTHFAVRHLRLRRDQRLLSPGMLDTMAPELPYAVAAQCAKIDHHRELRRHVPEAIYCAGKTPEQVAEIFKCMVARAAERFAHAQAPNISPPSLLWLRIRNTTLSLAASGSTARTRVWLEMAH